MQLNPVEQTSILQTLRHMQLLGPQETAALTPLTGGVSSLIVRADTARGPLCVKSALAQLKVAAVWKAPVERNRAEVAWMRFAQSVWPDAVPAILGEDAQACAFAMAYLPPEDHPVWKAQLRDGVAEPATARAVAKRVVRIHAASAAKPGMAASFANDADFYALRLEPYFTTTALRQPSCAGALHQLVERTASTRLALVHGDVSPKNILVGPRGPVLLDAECATWGDPAFDLAFCLNHLLLKCLWRPDATPGFLACFDAFATQYLAGVNWEAPGALEARACQLLAGMLLARVDGKSPAEYITTDAARNTVRRVAMPLLLQPAAHLSHIRHTWSQTL